MTDMVEKVARVIAPTCFEPLPDEIYGFEPDFRKFLISNRKKAQEQNKDTARAVIRALMEPTDRMLRDGHAAGARKNMIWEAIPEGELPLRLLQEYLPAAWQAMLKAALDD